MTALELKVENVRCFVGKHTIPVKPLTLLVGENSSGKSTLLALLSALSDPGFPFRPRFNDPPYSLGGFSTIATNASRHVQRGSVSAERASSFSIGFSREDPSNGTAEVLSIYGSDHGEVALWELQIRSSDGRASAKRDPSGGYSVRYRIKDRPDDLDFYVDPTLASDVRFDAHEILLQTIYSLADANNALVYPGAYVPARRIITNLALTRTVSIAPIRTTPKRTYDWPADEPSSQGDHIPYELSKILSESDDSARKESVLLALRRFGQQSGLLSDVAIRSLGDTSGDPFQVMIRVGGKQVNILDVGYGVSQMLPIVLQSILAAKGEMLLIQQPEVHLHPRAQAALGSFFVEMVAKAKKALVVETHSDYIMDRIRQEVAAGRIRSEDVVFLYLERKGLKTRVFPLTLDKLGNIEGAPPTYRDFFLRETMNLLSRGN